MISRLYIDHLQKQYVAHLKNVVLHVPFQPIVLRGGKNKPNTTKELHEAIRQFQEYEKRGEKKGWVIDWEEWSSRKFGKQQWPATVRVDTEEDFLFLIKKEKEIRVFKDQLHRLLEWNVSIGQWLAQKPMLVPELQASWQGICEVVDYLLHHDVSGRYLRSIPVPVHTKFVEQHKKVIHSLLAHLDNERFSSKDADLTDILRLNKKPFLFKARWLDETCAAQLTSGMDIFGVPVDFLQKQDWKIRQVILVENETNLYLLPSLPGTLALCSFGKAMHLLKEIDFLGNTRLYYWGDLDEQGFCMLNDLRTYYPHVISLFMDSMTVMEHSAEMDMRKPVNPNRVLPMLNPAEKEAYDWLMQQGKWLEQEKLQQLYVQDKFLELFS